MTIQFLSLNHVRNWACASLLSLGLVACGGSNSTDITALPDSGSDDETELMISLTDAEGDFLSYAVNLTSLTLMRSNGASVEVLTESTTVDFAQYVDISELLAVRTIPVGNYESVVLNLDFTDAQIIVQSDEGEAIQAQVFDSEGAALESARIDIDFASDDAFVLSPRIVSHITLDFDLDASNEIEIDGDEASVIVSPIWVADPIQEDPKPMRLRGVLAEVDSANSSFDINIRPFRKQISGFGEATVYVDSETEYEIDGEIVASDAGLNELAGLDANAPVVTMGVWDRDTRHYTATDVYAGSSVPWAESDIMRGTVIEREANEVTVRGALLELSDGRFVFNDTLTLLIGDATTVLKRGDENAGIEDISIGSALRVVGSLIDDQTLDAREGYVRVHATSLSGIAVSNDPLVLDLSFINGRRASLYDFEGTGVSTDADADPDNYEVATATLDTVSVFEGDPIRALGFVSEFGTAPADFNAEVLIDASEVKALLTAHYGREGSVGALSISDADVLLLNLDAARANLVKAGIPVDLSESDVLAVSPSQESAGIFSVAVGRRVEVYTRYSDFIDALDAYLSSESALLRFTAQGEYDSLAGTLTSKRMQVHLRDDASLE